MSYLKSTTIRSLLRFTQRQSVVAFNSTQHRYSTVEATNDVKTKAINENVSFAKLFRESKFVSLGYLGGKVLIGRVVQVIDNDIYIDYGGKFHCICRKSIEDLHNYVRNDLVKIVLKEFEMASHFLGAAKHITLLESDARLQGDDDDDDWDSDSENDGFIFDINDLNNNQKKPLTPIVVKNEPTAVTKISTNNWSANTIVASTPLLPIKKESDALVDFKQAIINQNIDKVKLMAAQNETNNANLVFNNGWSPLMYAVMGGSLELTRLFVSKGADVNYKTDRVSVLMCACACKRIHDESLVEIVKFLVESGADYQTTDRYCTTPLMFACREGNLSVLKYLIGLGVEINQQDENGWTALVYACNKGHLECVRELLKNGAKPDLVTFDRSYAADVAQNSGYLKIHALIERYIRTKKLDLEDERGVECQQASTLTAVKSDDLEQFLNLVKMTHLKEIFTQHKITFKDLLIIKDEELEKIGIADSKTRITLLDEITKAHKENWKPSSLMPHRYTNELSPQEISAIMKNMSRHCEFIASTVKYIYAQTSDENGRTLKEYSNSCQNLRNEIDLVMNSSSSLCKEVSKLASHIIKNFPNQTKSEGDLIDLKSQKSTRYNKLAKLTACTAVISIPLIIWKKFF